MKSIKRARRQMKGKTFNGDPWPTIQAHPRRRGRPTSEEREARRRLDQAQRDRLARGLVTVLVWSHDGHVYCGSRCIVDSTGLFEKGTDWTYIGWLDRQRELEEATDGDELDDILGDRAWSDFDIRYIRGHVTRGRWPLPRYEVRRHFAADVEHLTCRQCGKPFKRAMPDTAWTRRLKSQHRRAKLRAARARERDYRRKLKERQKLEAR